MLKRIFACFLAVSLLLTALCSLASCDTDDTASGSEDQSSGGITTVPTYTYNDYLEETPAVWSLFGWKTDEDEYILKLTQTGLYDFSLN